MYNQNVPKKCFALHKMFLNIPELLFGNISECSKKNVYPKKFTKNDQPTIQIVYKKVLETPSQKHQALVFSNVKHFTM